MVAEPVTLEDLEPLFNRIAAYYEGLLARIAGAIETVFTELADKIDTLFTKVISALESIVNNIAEIVGNIFGKIEEFIQTTIESILLFIDEVLTDIVLNINTLIKETSEYIKQSMKQLVGFIEQLLIDTSGLFTKLFDKIYESIEIIVGDAMIMLRDMFDVVVSAIERITLEVRSLLQGLFDIVTIGVTTILDSVTVLIQQLDIKLRESIDTLNNVVGGALRAILDKISNLPREIAELTTQIIESARTNIGEPITSLPEALVQAFAAIVKPDTIDTVNKAFVASMDLIFGTSPVERSPEKFRELLETKVPTHPILETAAKTMLGVMGLAPSLMGMSSATSEIMLQSWALDNPYRLLDPADLIRSNHFDLLSTDIIVTDLRKHGYTESDAVILSEIGKKVAPEAEQIVWWLRGMSPGDEFDTALAKHGWTQTEIEKLKQSAFFIPPVQDLITMAVREVFTPAVAERFGQFEDFPPQFVDQAAKVGLSEEWALNYWGAHWALPSVQMGFEMLHRRVIVKEELDLLLRSADVMPFWRDKLIAISYQPLTRVDIRRMHKMGVLTNDQVLDAYQDIGYIDTDAQLLLDFTIALNEPNQAQDADDLSSLTRSNIINFFTDGIFSRNEAEVLLQGLGMSEDAANIYLDDAEYKLERAERKDETTIIIDQADSGILTFEAAQDALNRLGLETNEVKLALNELAKREARRTKLPSREDLDKMLGAKLIDAKEYISTMNRIGFATIWADRYLKLTQGT